MPVVTKSRQIKAIQKTTPVTRRLEAASAPPRIIRDPDFARRLTQACDGHALVPPKHSGRLTWVQRELRSRFDEAVSVETIRKWFEGESKPRPDKLVKLAQLLEVDLSWLSLGVDPDMAPRERKIRNAMADGAVNLVAGLIQMDGGYPAFPEGGAESNVDLHAIIKGAKYDLHISLGEIEDQSLRFIVPHDYADMLVLGLIKRDFQIEVIEIPSEMIEVAGEDRGGSIKVSVGAAEAKRYRIENFKSRL